MAIKALLRLLPCLVTASALMEVSSSACPYQPLRPMLMRHVSRCQLQSGGQCPRCAGSTSEPLVPQGGREPLVTMARERVLLSSAVAEGASGVMADLLVRLDNGEEILVFLRDALTAQELIVLRRLGAQPGGGGAPRVVVAHTDVSYRTCYRQARTPGQPPHTVVTPVLHLNAKFHGGGGPRACTSCEREGVRVQQVAAEEERERLLDAARSERMGREAMQRRADQSTSALLLLQQRAARAPIQPPPADPRAGSEPRPSVPPSRRPVPRRGLGSGGGARKRSAPEALGEPGSTPWKFRLSRVADGKGGEEGERPRQGPSALWSPSGGTVLVFRHGDGTECSMPGPCTRAGAASYHA